MSSLLLDFCFVFYFCFSWFAFVFVLFVCFCFVSHPVSELYICIKKDPEPKLVPSLCFVSMKNPFAPLPCGVNVGSPCAYIIFAVCGCAHSIIISAACGRDVNRLRSAVCKNHILRGSRDINRIHGLTVIV